MKNKPYQILPEFPKTPHLPYNPNVDPDDIVAESHEVSSVFTGTINIEEKIDGASVGMTILDGNPLIRNRDRILSKGCTKNTAAKKQFSNIWNWFYKNKKRFEALAKKGPFSIFGEWCWAQHGIIYNQLPDWFIAYDVYNYEQSKFVAPCIAREMLQDLEFVTPTLIFQGRFNDGYDQLTEWAERKSSFSDSQAEGIYIKTSDEKWVLQRFKMVRSGFERGKFWNPKQLKKNQIFSS